MKIYDISVKSIDCKSVSISKYQGKVLLIVNTATGCGFTPQYLDLEKIYKKYKDKGFEILDFPCNQFAGQSPGSNNEINEFCQINYNTTFNRFSKIDVNGKNQNELYKFLKTQKKGFISSKIKWNFTKFLVDRKGNVIKRYSPSYSLDKVSNDIAKLL